MMRKKVFFSMLLIVFFFCTGPVYAGITIESLLQDASAGVSSFDIESGESVFDGTHESSIELGAFNYLDDAYMAQYDPEDDRLLCEGSAGTFFHSNVTLDDSLSVSIYNKADVDTYVEDGVDADMWADSFSYSVLDFELTDNAYFQLSACIWGDDISSVRMQLANWEGDFVFYFDSRDTILSEGELPAGTYTLYLANWTKTNEGTANYSTGFSADFSVSPVPVPGAVWLLGSCLLGVTGGRRLRKSL
jgi:hypothetical protein